MLLDSNIIIYLSSGNAPERVFEILHQGACASVISMVETLGYHKIKAQENAVLREAFSHIKTLPISQAVINTAIVLRQQRNMSLGDCIIASTALEHQLTLCTRNTDDFQWIEGLKLENPFEE